MVDRLSANSIHSHYNNTPRYRYVPSDSLHGYIATGFAVTYALLPLSLVTLLYLVILREAMRANKKHCRSKMTHAGRDYNAWRAPLTVSFVVGKEVYKSYIQYLIPIIIHIINNQYLP